MTPTRWLIVGLTAGVGGLDVLLAVHGGIPSTISAQMTNWSFGYPALPFAWGFLMGHWFGVYGPVAETAENPAR